MTAVGAYAYPWDLVGDPAAAETFAGSGIRRVSLAAAYHSVRALTPRHPQHRVVTAGHAASYVELKPHRWAGRRLQPAVPTWAPGPAGFGPAADALRAAGLDVFAWVVVVHNGRLAAAHPDLAVRNAFGDVYPWTLCPASAEVAQYAADLAAECAEQPGLSGVELESTGWFGLSHLSAHDKVGGVPLAPGEDLLASLCFCPACRDGYAAAGIEPDELAGRVRAALDARFAGSAGPDLSPAPAVLAAALGDGLAAAVLDYRVRTSNQFRAGVVAAVRTAAPHLTVLLHADPRPWHTGAFTGVDVTAALHDVDGLVLACPATGTPPHAQVAEVAAVAAGLTGPAGPDVTAGLAGRHVVANVTAVAGMGGAPESLAQRAAAAIAAGATDLHLYHAGLAGADDLTRFRDVVEAVRQAPTRTGAAR